MSSPMDFMFVTEDVFSWDIWSEENPPGPMSLPTIARGAPVQALSGSPYSEDGALWFNILYRNRPYRIATTSVSLIPPPKLARKSLVHIYDTGDNS